MSWTRPVRLQCDFCTRHLIMENRTVPNARWYAHTRYGWRQRKDGRDICQDCLIDLTAI